MNIENAAETISTVLFVVAIFSVFAMLAAEKTNPYRRFDASVTKDSVITNTAAFLFNNVILTLLRASSLFFIAQEFSGFGLLHSMSEGPLKWILTFLLYDFAIYAWHYVNHHNDFLWRFHKVHHSDKAFNVTTGFRFHVLDLFIEIPYKCLVVIVFGVNAYIILAIETIQLLFILFHHSNLRIPAEDKLSHIFITPYLHRVHHSSLRTEHDSNYGIVLSLWDRIFRTRKDLIPAEIGLDLIVAHNFVQLFSLAFITERHMKRILQMIPQVGSKGFRASKNPGKDDKAVF